MHVTLNSKDQLRALYGEVSIRAKDKVLRQLDKHAIHFIERSPFFLLASYSLEGQVDNSPRGGLPGFVQIQENQLLIPDAKGNNRVDSLINIVETGRIGLIFLIPGVNETLRVNGSAILSTDPELIARFEDKSPIKSVIVVNVEEVFLHCAKALMRSKLWNPDQQIDRKSFPTMGQMLKDQLNWPGPAESQEDMEHRYRKEI